MASSSIMTSTSTIGSISSSMSSRSIRANVHFAEESNVYHPPTVRVMDPRDTWYTAAEMQAFDQDARQHAARLEQGIRQLQQQQQYQQQHRSNYNYRNNNADANETHQWVQNWLRVYFLLRLQQPPQQEGDDNYKNTIADMAKEKNLTLPAHHLGFYDRYLSPIVADYLMRRQHLLQQFGMLQQRAPQNIHENNRNVAKLIQQTSVLASQASCDYARVVALVLAREEANEHSDCGAAA